MKFKHSQWILPFGVLGVSTLAWAAKVHLAQGTPVHVRLKADLSSASARARDRVDLEVSQPLAVAGHVLAPVGSVAWGAVQSVKADKEIKFDIEGVRLSNLKEVKLRSIRERSKNPVKDEIRVVGRVEGGIGTARGTEFVAYVDEDADVEVTGEAAAAPAAPKPATQPAPPVEPKVAEAKPSEVTPVGKNPADAEAATAPTSPPPQTEPTPASQPETRPAEPLPQPVSQPAAQPAAPATTSRPATNPPLASSPGGAPATSAAAVPSQDWMTAKDWVTVECFSDPSGADIVIDGYFVGNTPSILKVPVGNHHLELTLAGHQPASEVLYLALGTGIRTIRKTLEAKE